ncbi:hypothetical protein AAULH_14341, partial [Lactobacillus helveticus MTCC 5463]
WVRNLLKPQRYLAPMKMLMGRTPNEEAAADVIWLGTILELALNRILFFLSIYLVKLRFMPQIAGSRCTTAALTDMRRLLINNVSIIIR